MATSKRRFRSGFVVLGVIALALFAWGIFGKKPAKPQKAPAVAVAVARVTSQDVPVVITALGAAQPWSSVTIHAQVSGKLLSVPFPEGGDVRAGQLLAQIDPAPFEAALLQAQGTLKRDQALLEDARLDLARYQTLAAQDSIARQQVDTQAALVKQDEGTVVGDEGAVKTAQVNLGYCRITSPTSGRAGVRLVDAGNLVSASDATGITTVNEVSPIAVTFTVPQGDFQRLFEASEGFRRPMKTEAISQDNSGLLDIGELSIADNHVDAATATVELKARFPNAKQTLWPGQFVNVQLTLQTLAHVLTVPNTAINQGPNGAFLYVVGPDDAVAARPVKVVASQGDIVVVKGNVKVGDAVVVDGQMVLKPGMKVRAATTPSAKTAAT
ncbi:MAG: efflux RND transporter periplasmic adaptor subunit [Caulobacteraceae bacterium]|nr:efflux RND transporter periplasmic adaptor subunit [Caulobacteraceae bacterium]